MSLPKNFNKTKNLINRFNSFNQLTFYIITYDFELSDNYEENANKLKLNVKSDLNGVKEIPAIDLENSVKKITTWFESLVSSDIIKNYEIKSITPRTFQQVLKDKNLYDIVKRLN
jgi:hypothetical protein